jgi:hypothetical protein
VDDRASAPTGRLRAYLELIAALVFVWAALAVYAFSAREIEVGGVLLDKAPIAEYFRPHTELGEVGSVAAAPRVGRVPRPGESAAIPAVAPAAQVNTAPQRILLVGDSMVFNLIPRLSDYCLQNGHTLKPAIWYASTTIAWGSQSKLDQLITEFEPTFVLIVLGSSELTSRSMEGRAQSVRNMLQKIGDREMAWVGPPNWRPDTGINALLEAELGKDRFFRSAELELERESDGIHPNRAAGSQWADLIAAWLEREGRAHIVMKTPERTGTPPSPVIFPPPYKVPP